jgi:hypothetical protein
LQEHAAARQVDAAPRQPDAARRQDHIHAVRRTLHVVENEFQPVIALHLKSCFDFQPV